MDGYASLARKAMCWYSTDDDANFDLPVVITADDTTAYSITTDNVFSVDIASDALTVTELTTSNQPTLGFYTDAVFFNGILQVSGNSTVKSYSGGSWTSRISGLSTSYPHPLCVNEKSQKLMVGDGNVVKQYDTSYTIDSTNQLTIPSEYYVTGIRFKGNTAFIATRNVAGGHARLFIWNCLGTGNNGSFKVKGDWIYSMEEFEGTMMVIDSSGQLVAFNGGGFTFVDAFPVFYTPYSWGSNASTSSLVGRVASRGMTSIGDTIYMNVDGGLRNSQTQYPGSYLVSQPSGLWTFDRKSGLVHKAGYNHKTKLSLTPSSLNSSHLVFSTAHQATTGDPILCSVKAGITGTTSGQVYYAIVDSTTSLQLAVSPNDAYAGRFVLLSGTPSTDKFVLDRYESYGHTKIVNAGGIYAFSRTIPNLMYGSEVLFGVKLSDSSNTSKSGMMSLGMGKNRGYIVTPKIPSAGVTDFFSKLYALFTSLNLTSDEVVVKYRTTEKFGYPKTLAFSSGTQSWASTTTLTVDTTTKDFRGCEVGEEIEFVMSAGAGYTAHITAIDDTTSTYTVTIDETVPVTASDKTDFVVDNWKKHEVFNNLSENNDAGFGENLLAETRSKWVQFKIEMRGRDISMELLTLVNSINKPAT